MDKDDRFPSVPVESNPPKPSNIPLFDSADKLYADFRRYNSMNNRGLQLKAVHTFEQFAEIQDDPEKHVVAGCYYVHCDHLFIHFYHPDFKDAFWVIETDGSCHVVGDYAKIAVEKVQPSIPYKVLPPYPKDKVIIDYDEESEKFKCEWKSAKSINPLKVKEIEKKNTDKEMLKYWKRTEK